MNLETVRLFLEVADAGSLSKVAARRQTVQSHISRQIAEFEISCGGRLFHRTGRGVVLTELGERAATRLRVWLHETEQLSEELKSDAGHVMGEVRLGILPSAAHPLMTRLFHRLQEKHPSVHLCISEAQGAELDAMLDGGAVDLAILFRFRRPSGREEKLLCEAHTYLVSAPDDPLTNEPTVDFAKLRGLRLVVPRRPGQWRQALDETARGIGFQLQSAVEADSLTTQKELVAHTPGLYAVLGPYAFTSEVARGHLRASQIIKPDLCRHVVLAMPRHGKHSAACRVVADEIQQIIAQWGYQLTEPPALHDNAD
ncbi:LysR family transcriptional regulator [Pandoraea horticolens]|uniref:LysR family transcriptional regulator n=1 Tax=Pandoraea horticolens TaxID=2508298 RepID=A0A5E4VGQ4_9BURK|nr:LysR family transcriptional regulator [Pandoraea horticolens]VVE11402.1 LysR family transcriptional regulator [Pandoraea horticolens]